MSNMLRVENLPTALEALLGPPASRHGGEWLYRCPWREDRNPSLSVRVEGDRAGCWLDRATGEGKGEKLVDLVARVQGGDTRAAGQFLAQHGVLQPLSGATRPAPSPPAAPVSTKPQKQKAAPTWTPGPETLDELAKGYGLEAQDFAAIGATITTHFMPGLSRKERVVAYPVHSSGTKFKTVGRLDGRRECAVTKGTNGIIIADADVGGTGPLVLAGGEEKVLAARRAGFRACCWCFGEGDALKAAPILVESGEIEVIVCLDADEAGRKGAAKAAAALVLEGVPDVRIVVWPEGTPDKHDLNDVLVSEGEDSVRRLLESALLAQDVPEVRELLQERDDALDGGEEPWPEPIPLPDRVYGDPLADHLLEVAPVLHAMTTEAAIAFQVPLEAAALLALGAVGGVCGRRVRVRLKRDWSEPANIHCLGLMESGARKSGLIAEIASTPLASLERRRIDATAVDRATRRSIHEALQERRKKAVKDASKAAGSTDTREKLAQIEQLLLENPSPSEPRLLASNVTMEQLASLLAESGGRIVVVDAEAAILGIASGRYNSGAFGADTLLKGHAGDVLVIDRRGRREFVERPALGLLLMLQPGIFEGFLAAAPAARHSGLAARFLYAFPVPTVGRREINPPSIRDASRSAWWALLEQLDDLPEGDEVEVTLTEEAGALLDSFRHELEPRLAKGAELGEIADWASKLPGAIARIALALHMARHGVEGCRRKIEHAVMASAIEIGRCLTSHAKAILGVGNPGLVVARRILATLMKCGGTATREKIGDDLRQKAEVLDEAFALLARHRRVRQRSEPTGGRSRTTYKLNPRHQGELSEE